MDAEGGDHLVGQVREQRLAFLAVEAVAERGIGDAECGEIAVVADRSIGRVQIERACQPFEFAVEQIALDLPLGGVMLVARKSVVLGKRWSGRMDLGGWRHITHTTNLSIVSEYN